MPLPVIANTVRAAVLGFVPSGQRWENVWHFRFTGGGAPAAADITALDGRLRRVYSGAAYGAGAAYFGAVTTNVSAQQAVYTPLDGSSVSTVIPWPPLLGTVAGDSLPSQDSVVITLITALRGRRNRGRIFLVPPSESNSDSNGRLSATVVTNFGVQLAGLLADLPTINWNMVVASYLGAVATTVTVCRVNNNICVQRRRRQ